MGTQSYGDAKTLSLYYGSDNEPEADFPFNFQLIKLPAKNVTGFNIYDLVKDWVSHIPNGKWLNWVVSE